MSTDITIDPAHTTAVAQPGLLRSAMKLWRTRIGVALVVLLVGVAIVGPWVAPYGPAEFVGTANLRNVEGAWLGTDYFGQDVWSRFLHGGRSILFLASVATLIGFFFGAAIGLVAAYNRGRIDDALMRFMDIILAFPQLLLALVALTTVGPQSWLIIAIVAFTTIPRIARITRGAAVPVVERDFIGAAEALGESRLRIITRELLPNVTGPLLVEANLRLTYSIGIIAGLGFLGFATERNAADWGLMVQENRVALSVQPWGTVLPAVAIALLTIGTGLISDGLARTVAGIDRGRPDA
ncbi:MAG: ABC transporter permease [Acidimicrobiaceae bacterium]|jgi:peptide/nickel transport system permease protein|nr:ABC transporter permease [Acidimicrobiaceae bacterium]MBK9970227.1 ABC transporter permease [Acidimicrobiaceae bacterium]HQY13666.1 ABC transporter permease [Ilumatobacteraceae bacterium]HQY84380.1 ABC transporter permease [Ilumatobacteraceae bacterium]HRA83136.1 ABC transporter permease [Ilumatobacteraceae bacterium]